MPIQFIWNPAMDTLTFVSDRTIHAINSNFKKIFSRGYQSIVHYPICIRGREQTY
jgi:hypothetical protein